MTGIEHMGGGVGCLGSGKDFGCRFTYKAQDDAGGIAQATTAFTPLTPAKSSALWDGGPKSASEADWR